MAYDAAKAHEYYEKYRKKGLKKGRKKGSKKSTGKGKGKTKSTNLVGLSSSGLNDEGRMQAALIKEDIKKQMNTALSKAKTDAEKQSIKQEYQKKAFDAINKLKTDSKYAKAKVAKSGSGSKSSKSGGLSKSSGSSGKSSGSAKATTTASSGSSAKTSSEAVQASVKNIQNLLTGLSDKINALPAEKKEEIKTEVKKVVTQIRAQLSNGPDALKRIDWDKLSKSLK